MYNVINNGFVITSSIYNIVKILAAFDVLSDEESIKTVFCIFLIIDLHYVASVMEHPV